MHSSSIGSTRRTDAPGRSRRTASSADDRFSGLLDELTGGDRTAATAAADGAAAVGGLLGLCEVPTATDRPARRRALDRGADLLDQLDRLQLDILGGRIPTVRLIAMSQQVRARRDLCGDPRIEALIDAIELRVQVEVAKTGDRV